MLHQRQQLVAPVEEPEQHADPHVVDARLHGAVHRRHAPVVVLLLAGEVDAGVGAAVVGFLEELIGADLRGLELPELVEGERRHVHVDAADLAPVVGDAVDGVDRLEDVREPLARVGLAGHEQHALVALVDEHPRFRGDLVLRERAPLEFGVARPEGAVRALVAAQVRDVQRREHHEPPAVDGLLDVLGGLEQLVEQVRVADVHQRGHVVRLEAVHLPGLRQHRAHPRGVRVPVPLERGGNGVVVDGNRVRDLLHGGRCSRGADRLRL